LAIFHILTKLNYLSTLCRYQCTTVGRMGNHYVWQSGQTQNTVGKKFFSALCAKFYQTNVCPPWPETQPTPLHPRQITMPTSTAQCFTGRMPFLPLNQQHQSTEGK